MYVANVFTLLVSILVIPFLIKILSVPVKYMIPIITCVCIVGAYSTSNSMYGVIIMFISGIVGYLLDKKRLPHRSYAAGLRAGAHAGEKYA